MKPVYDFLSAEERIWVVRCQFAAVLLFLGLLAAIALADDGQPVDGTSSTHSAGSRAVAAEPLGAIEPRTLNPDTH